MKKLLSYTICLILALSLANSAYAQNLVQDGSFEDNPITNSSNWQIFDVNGPWYTQATSGTPDAEDPVGLELQKSGLFADVNATNGDQYAELDAFYPLKLYQNINTCQSGKYKVSFDYAPRPNVAENHLVAMFGSETLTDTGIMAAPPAFVWTHFEDLEIEGPKEGTIEISFTEMGPNDQLGMFLDNVSVECVEAPEPIVDSCPEGYTPQSIQTLPIPCDKAANYISTSSLVSGNKYLFKASGTCFWRTENNPGGYLADAEWWLRNDAYGTTWTKMNPGSIAIWTGSSPENIDWGEYNDQHTYYHSYNPTSNGAVQFYFYDDVYTDNSGSLNLEIFECKADQPPFVRYGEITKPEDGDEVLGETDFKAFLMSQSSTEKVSWAVRKGTCAANTGTVFGNVDGFSNDFSWKYNTTENQWNFLANTDTCKWVPGEYCFVFNPGGGIRKTRLFTVSECDNDGDTVPDYQDQCLGTNYDKPTVSLGTNRHVWYGGKNFTTLIPAKKGKFIEEPSKFSLEDTYGCSCTQILELIKEKSGDELLGHYKFGCSKSILDQFIASFEE